MADIVYDQSVSSLVNNNKVSAIYDFVYGEYLATNSFLSELSSIQSQILDGDLIDIGGMEIDLETVGGNLALNIHMQNMDAEKETMSGLAKLGLKTENKLWTLLG